MSFLKPRTERIFDLLTRRLGSEEQGEEEPGFQAVQRTGMDQASLEQIRLGAGESVGHTQDLTAPGSRGQDDGHLSGEILQGFDHDGGYVATTQSLYHESGVSPFLYRGKQPPIVA